MKKTDKFIRTSSVPLTEKLKKMGFTEIATDNEHMHTFVNNGTLNFSDEELSQIVFTNVLHT